MKKFLSLVLALVMTMSLVTVSAGAKDFTDNDKLNYEEAVAVISDLKVIDGYADGSFKPQGNLTRQAAAKIICNLILGPTTASALRADTAPFKDVPVNNDFAGYITYCSQQGIISGYADGEFKPGNPLTGYAFMKMLLGALGYDAAAEQYVGPNWSVSVAKRALGIGLNAGLVENFDGVKAITREEAALYAFNTLKATMVEYDSKITVGDVVIAGSAAKEVAQSGYKDTMDKGNLQFAEKYFPKLSVKPTQDVFGRPANEWINNKKSVGTYVDYTLQVGEWTEAVSGKDVYDALGSTAVKDGVEVYVDGADETKAVAKEIVKNNKDDIANSGNGVLTQAFYDKDNEQAYLTFVNTYLAIANSDYSEKKDTASLTVYLDKDGKTETIKGEDFAIAETVEEDDAFLVTYDAVNKEIVDVVAAEVIDETEIEEFSKKGSVTVDGDEIKRSAKALYDEAVLEAYTDGGDYKNLKDTIYNVYMDAYGYYIGVDVVEAPTNYVFITAADGGNSNLATKTLDAFAIFLDGTAKNIEVKNTDEIEAGIQINSWYKYTVSKSDVYTLTAIDDASEENWEMDKVAQYADDTYKQEINKKHISLPGADEGTYSKVYGNDDTVYLSAELDEVKISGTDDKAGTYTVISGVDNVTTGVRNVNIQVKAGGEKKAGGVYTLFKENGYVIATVVVGEDAGASKNLVYVHSGDVAREKYNKETGMWTWTRKVILDGEEVTLTETNDEGVSVLDEMKSETWYQVTYKSDETVKSAKKLVLSDATSVKADEVKFDGYALYWTKAVQALEDEDVVVFDDKSTNTDLKLVGNTLFKTGDSKTGIFVSDDVKVVLIQTNDNKETTEYDVGVKHLKNALSNLNEDEDGEVSYTFDAIIEDGAMTVAIITDKVVNGVIDDDDDTTATIKGAEELKMPENMEQDDAQAIILSQEDGLYQPTELDYADLGGSFKFNAEDLMVFKYTAPAAGKALLTITDEDGEIVYVESQTAVEGANMFYEIVSTTETGWENAGSGTMKTQSLDGTYDFTVKVGTKTVLDGSFTVTAKD